jgi:GTP-binding protein
MMVLNYNNIELEFCCGIPSQLRALSLPEIVFSGRSNVGKSSLINKLLNRKSLARTSAKPGKTATINFYKIDNSVYFVDLPGYGYANVSLAEKKRWASLVNSYIWEKRNFSLFVQLIDIRYPHTESDKQMLTFFKKMNRRFIIVLTKSDKLKKKEYERRLGELRLELCEFEEIPRIFFSSVTGQGVSELKKFLWTSINGR